MKFLIFSSYWDCHRPNSTIVSGKSFGKVNSVLEIDLMLRHTRVKSAFCVLSKRCLRAGWGVWIQSVSVDCLAGLTGSDRS
jgi:hypothetical protein